VNRFSSNDNEIITPVVYTTALREKVRVVVKHTNHNMIDNHDILKIDMTIEGNEVILQGEAILKDVIHNGTLLARSIHHALAGGTLLGLLTQDGE
jgi:hypothetical protein